MYKVPCATKRHPGFAVIDIETTDLNPAKGHRIVEIAIVLVSVDGKIEARYSTMVNPERSPGVVRIHRLAKEMLDTAPTFRMILPQLIKLISNRIPVAHNAKFETQFLTAEFDRCGYTFPLSASDFFDTKKPVYDLWPTLSKKLSIVCDNVGITLDANEAHTAMADTVATAELLNYYIRYHPEVVYNKSRKIGNETAKWPVLTTQAKTNWVPRPKGTTNAPAVKDEDLKEQTPKSKTPSKNITASNLLKDWFDNGITSELYKAADFNKKLFELGFLSGSPGNWSISQNGMDIGIMKDTRTNKEHEYTLITYSPEAVRYLTSIKERIIT